MPYQIGNESGIIVQTKIQTGLENNTKPIKQTLLQIKAPQIEGKTPSKVKVVANTYASNNQTEEQFNQNNCNYDSKTGIITIQVENQPQDNIVQWNQNQKDEYKITYIYERNDEETITEENNTQQNNIQIAQVSILAYGDEKEISKAEELQIDTNETKGNIVQTNMQTVSELSKGNLYIQTANQAEYELDTNTEIAYADVMDEINIQLPNDTFVTEDGQVFASGESTKYLETAISKQNFLKILGEEGSIQIIGRDGEQIAVFNKETSEDENGNYKYTYTGEPSEITIKTTKPVTEGTLKLSHKKALKAEENYDTNIVKAIKVLEQQAKTKVINGTNEIANNEAKIQTNLIDPTTRIETKISKENLSTIVKNENVEIKTILKTYDYTCDLYKNPCVEIELPEFIETVDLKDVNLLYDSELQIKDYKTYKNEQGNIIIQVIVEGEETKYNQDGITNGANISIVADLTLKELTPTTESAIKTYITNQNATSYETSINPEANITEQKGYAQTYVKAVAPVGMVTTNEISGYNQKNETATSISGQEEIGRLDVGQAGKQATVTMNIINNYEATAKNIKILGTTPSSGNKDVETKQELNSNLTTGITNFLAPSGIDEEKVDIYYSENADATKDLQDANNGWTTEITENTKTYLINLNDYEMETGDKVTFAYNVNIPENLSHNQQTYENYTVYFDNVTEERTIEDKQIATKVGLTTGQGPELKVTIEPNIGAGKDVEEGKLVIYSMKVKNVGKETVNNITVTGNIPEGSVYTYFEGDYASQEGLDQISDENRKEYSEVIEALAPNEEAEITYVVKVLTRQENAEVTLNAEAKATVENVDTVFASDIVSNKVVEGFITTEITLAPRAEVFDRSEEENVTYFLDLRNEKNEGINDITITDVLPEGVTYVEASSGSNYNEKARTVTWNIKRLMAEGVDSVSVKVKTNKLGNNENRKTISNKMTITAGGKSISSDEIAFDVVKPGISIKQTSDITTNKVSVGDTINYTITVKNEGGSELKNINIKDYLPKELKYEGATFTDNGSEYTSNIYSDYASIGIHDLAEGEEKQILVKATVQPLESGVTERTITNTATANYLNGNEVEANKITHTIISDGSGSVTGDPSVSEVVEGTYRISGTAWLDSNTDGKMDDDETRLSNITVMLLDADTGKIVKDISTGSNKEQTTSENGTYIFANLKAGKYMVVYLYDEGNYSVTAYKKEGVPDTLNSDATSMKVQISGTTRNTAATNTLEIKDSSISNVNLGLIENKKFDLKLDKVVSKVTLVDKNGTKINETKDAKLAKLDIPDKTINGANVVIEYKIKITNEGGVSGYAKKIVDYLPSEMKFTVDLNKDWYKADDGNLYNASLANTLIKPGETKELTLILTKTMTGTSTGPVHNTAEIYEASTDVGLTDYDSTPANQVQSEDDYSSADVLLGVKTGEVYIYVVITMLCVGVFGVGIYFIKKKVLIRV